jgi:hypothetical protein
MYASRERTKIWVIPERMHGLVREFYKNRSSGKIFARWHFSATDHKVESRTVLSVTRNIHEQRKASIRANSDDIATKQQGIASDSTKEGVYYCWMTTTGAPHHSSSRILPHCLPSAAR